MTTKHTVVIPSRLHVFILEKFGETLEIFQYLIESLGEPDHYQGNLKDAIVRAKKQYNKTSYLFDVEKPDNDILVDKM